ncbi:MAG: hypothetical protein LW809_04070 [Vampirovibrionales bacterium]|jgi:hypothetical protein|nr:hypothetical protein [Vampirovibrionales bacterium]
MTNFSIPAVPITYYDWRLRKVVTIGSPKSASTIQADTSYTIVRPNINPSDVVNYPLAPITVNASTGLADVDDVGYLWWDPKTQTLSRTNNFNDYASSFSATSLKQTYRVNTDAFTDYGNTFAPKIVPYTPLTSDFVPYYTQGNYANTVSSLVMSRDEWQALFDSGTEVIIPGIGRKVIQYGDGVKVIENSDGTLGIVSDSAGGLLAIEQHIDNNKWFWLTSFPQLDDYAIFQASQRLPSIIDLIDSLKENTAQQTPKRLPIPPPPQANLNTLAPIVTSATPKPLDKEAQASQLLGSSASTKTQAPVDVSPSLLGYISPTLKTNTATQDEDPLNPTKSLGLTFSDAPSLSADDLIQALAKIVQELLRQSNTTVEARRYSILPQGEGLSITDDPSSMSEDRLNELKQGQGSLGGSLSSEDGADMLKEEAQRNTPEVRRQKAMQLRYYLGL